MKNLKSIIVVFLVFSLFLSTFSIPLAFAIEDSWVSKAPLPLSCWGIVASNDKIYAIAGSGDYNNKTYSNNAVLEYDPNLDKWTIKDVMPIKRYSFALAAYQNRIYIIGEPDGLNQVYDPIADTWENRTSMPTPRTQLEANIVNGKIYLIAGRTGGASSTVGLNEVYDPETDTWTMGARMPTNRYGLGVAVVDDVIYAMGGPGAFGMVANERYIPIGYIPEFPSWTLLPLFLVFTLVGVLVKKRLSLQN